MIKNLGWCVLLEGTHKIIILTIFISAKISIAFIDTRPSYLFLEQSHRSLHGLYLYSVPLYIEYHTKKILFGYSVLWERC